MKAEGGRMKGVPLKLEQFSKAEPSKLEEHAFHPSALLFISHPLYLSRNAGRVSCV
jgi:hypothetical protein